ncbi:response regulator [Candidatus Parcubacteria bacterium]|nr:MAG: response regulator [Candidatus Parcubacteria bacterium]
MSTQYKILIVDDDDYLRSLYVAVFKEANFIVEEARDGLEALERIQKATPDMLFTGIVMPRMDGFELIKVLKQNVAFANIPVMISSHLGREEDRKTAQDLGAKEFIYKQTVTPKEVVDRALRWLHKKFYKLTISKEKYDANQLIKDHLVHCSDQGSEIIVNLAPAKESGVFEARIECKPKTES